MAALKRVVRRAASSNWMDDSGNYPTQQIVYQGKTGDSTVHLPYGFAANIPPDQLGLVLVVVGDDGYKVFLPESVQDRPSLGRSEVAVYHPQTGSSVVFKESGDIELTALDGAGTVTIRGNVETFGTLKNNGVDVGSTHSHIGSPTAPTGAVSNTGTPVP